jgi:dihydroorotase
MGCLERLAEFASGHGRRFYGLEEARGRIVLERKVQEVPAAYGEVVPFRAGEPVRWSVRGE